MDKKTCFKCGVEKEFSEFYAHKQMAGGLLGKCKECAKADVRKNYRRRRHQYAAYYKARSQSSTRKAQRALHTRNARAKNPLKYKARMAVGNALRSGLITKGPCRDCGVVNTEAHHDDYSRPLDVVWLCFACHRRVHEYVVQ